MTWIFSPSLHTKPLLILANNISTYVRTITNYSTRSENSIHIQLRSIHFSEHCKGKKKKKSLIKFKNIINFLYMVELKINQHII